MEFTSRVTPIVPSPRSTRIVPEQLAALEVDIAESIGAQIEQTIEDGMDTLEDDKQPISDEEFEAEAAKIERLWMDLSFDETTLRYVLMFRDPEKLLSTYLNPPVIGKTFRHEEWQTRDYGDGSPLSNTPFPQHICSASTIEDLINGVNSMLEENNHVDLAPYQAPVRVM